MPTRGLWLRVVAPGALLSLVAIGLVAAVTGGSRGGATLKAPAQGPAGTAVAPAARAALDAVLPHLMGFVEEARRLEFQRPVNLQLLDDDAFRRRIQTLTRRSLVEGNRRLRILKAFGLVPADTDLSKAQRDANAGTLGLYDPKTNRLVVRGKAPTPYVRAVIVHELTHALQDQHFNLQRTGALRGGSAQGRQAVIEGDASRIEQAYVDSLSAEDQQLYELEQSSLAAGSSAGPPAAVAAFAGFPYIFGSQFTTELVEESGQEALDAAFRSPPRTAEQLLHTDAFLTGETGRLVDEPEPDADRRPLIADTLGEFGLRVLLADVLPGDEVARAAEGWGGDRYVVWADRARNCARLHVVMDTRADAEELVAALRTWAALPANAGTTVEGLDPIAVTSCH